MPTSLHSLSHKFFFFASFNTLFEINLEDFESIYGNENTKTRVFSFVIKRLHFFQLLIERFIMITSDWEEEFIIINCCKLCSLIFFKHIIEEGNFFLHLNLFSFWKSDGSYHKTTRLSSMELFAVSIILSILGQVKNYHILRQECILYPKKISQNRWKLLIIQKHEFCFDFQDYPI